MSETAMIRVEELRKSALAMVRAGQIDEACEPIALAAELGEGDQ